MNGSATINGAGWKTRIAPRMICSKAERNISPLIGINPRVADHAAISVQPPRKNIRPNTQARLNNVVPGQRIHITPSATSATPAIHIQILVLVFIHIEFKNMLAFSLGERQKMCLFQNLCQFVHFYAILSILVPKCPSICNEPQNFCVQLLGFITRMSGIFSCFTNSCSLRKGRLRQSHSSLRWE